MVLKNLETGNYGIHNIINSLIFTEKLKYEFVLNLIIFSNIYPKNVYILIITVPFHF